MPTQILQKAFYSQRERVFMIFFSFLGGNLNPRNGVHQTKLFLLFSYFHLLWFVANTAVNDLFRRDANNIDVETSRRETREAKRGKVHLL